VTEEQVSGVGFQMAGDRNALTGDEQVTGDRGTGSATMRWGVHS
jgi:hypothetical protein